MNGYRKAWMFLAICWCLHSTAIGQEDLQDPREVQWLRSATEAARLARETGKPILVYVRSENCHYCDLLQRKTWQDPATQAMIMREMVPLKLTLEENREAVQAMKVKGYPSTVIFSASREYLARIDGFVTPEDFHKHLSKARLAMRQPATGELIR
jgi:thioredoxin-related protein